MLNFHSHLTFTALCEYRTYFQLLQTQLKQEIMVLKRWVRIQWYTAVDFQGWLRMTLKIKMVEGLSPHFPRKAKLSKLPKSLENMKNVDIILSFLAKALNKHGTTLLHITYSPMNMLATCI